MKYPFNRLLPANLKVPVAAGAAGSLAVLGGVLAVPSAQAATLVACSPSALISAVSSVATTGGTLSLATGCTYTLTAVNNATDGATGLPMINGGNVIIQGNGATISRSTTAPVFRLFAVGAGSLNLSSVTLSNGQADNAGLGGGAIFSSGGAGTLTVSGSTFTGNSSPNTTGSSGGAIDASGTLSVTGSTFSGNSAMEGGAINTQSTSSISNSTFTGNTGQVYGGGAVVAVTGTTTITGSTFSGNTTGSTGGGGAIDNDATVNVSNSTFTGNTGGSNGGGALQNFGTMNVKYSTLSGDSAPSGAELHNYHDATTPGSLTISDSIVANGQGGNCSGNVAVIDGGYNLDSGSSCGFTATGSKSSTNPALGALASNGGPTQTMALPATSPAVNAIPAATPGCTGSTDQRGVIRPQGTGCDMGAYELVGAPAGGAITGYASKCVDNYHSSASNGTIIDYYSCNGSNAQKWTFNSSGELVNTASGQCLNDAGYGGSGGKMVQWPCNTSYSNEIWTHNSSGHYVLKYNGLCLNDPGYSTTNGTQLIIWACGNYANENWSLPA